MQTLDVGKGTEDGFALFVDWCHALIGEQIGIQQHGGSRNRQTLNVKDGPELIFSREPASDTCAVQAEEPIPAPLLEIVRDASDRAARGEMGKTQWWQVTFGTHKALDASFGLHMMRMLGQSRAFQGRWRLGKDVLADFAVEDPAQPAAFAKQTIAVTFRCIGPGHGPRSATFARKQADFIRAALSFCTACRLEGGGFVKPLADDGFPPGSEANDALPELSVQGLPIWSQLSEAASNGASELVDRVINALTAYEHALGQPTDGAATVFYVAAMEALTVPNHRYSNQRVTSRFTQCVLTLARPQLEETLKHANFAEAFASTKKRVKTPGDLANRIYGLRSSPVHTGKFGLERDVFVGITSMEGPIRAALLGEIAEAAILEFLRCPFTSLIGHMDHDPACRIELTDEEHAAVRLDAHAKGQSIEDYILECLGLAPRDPR
jgi:hypothetical protein